MFSLPTQTLYELHHDAKIAHLDLSSANIMLVSEAASDWLKLRILDFGLAEAFLPAGSPSQRFCL